MQEENNEEFNFDFSRTYIYEGEEYILTGRSAKKENSVRPSRRSTRRKKPSQEIMVEIKPTPKKSRKNPLSGKNSETKWVKYNDLFMVKDELEED